MAAIAVVCTMLAMVAAIVRDCGHRSEPADE
jgi:hypothetical protein